MFYIALIKNYQDLGWFPQANDCYYTYRKEKRRRRFNPVIGEFNPLYGLAELLFLEIPFGYGVKPLLWLRGFAFVSISFGFYYLFFLRLKKCVSYIPNWTRHDTYAFLWSMIYSLNLMIPGINLVPLKDSFEGGSDLERKTHYMFPYDSEWVIWGQRTQLIIAWGLYILFGLMIGGIKI